MLQLKRNRVSRSRYAASDDAFIYNPTENYNLNDFLNLSVTKVQSIASSLSLRNVKKYKKEELIPLVFQKHEERQNQLNNVQEESKEEVSTTTSDALEFSEQLKNKFTTISHYKYNNDVWFRASSVANYLEYEIPKKAISDHVCTDDKVSFRVISSKRGDCQAPIEELHPDTVFINKYGIFDLVTKSRMPLARQFRKWLVTEVLPSILDTGSYISPAITNTQLVELQEKIQQIENEKQQLQIQLDMEKQIRLSKINRNQIQNSIPLDELYILTSKQYAREYIFKIGRSGNTPKRLKSLNTSRVKEDDLYICHRAKCYDAHSAEIHIHALLNQYRLQENREFFVIEFDDVREIMDHVCQSFCVDYNIYLQIITNSKNRALPEINPNIPPPINITVKEKACSNVITNYYSQDTDTHTS